MAIKRHLTDIIQPHRAIVYRHAPHRLQIVLACSALLLVEEIISGTFVALRQQNSKVQGTLAARSRAQRSSA